MNCPECKRDAGSFKGTCESCGQVFGYKNHEVTQEEWLKIEQTIQKAEAFLLYLYFKDFKS